MDLRQKYQAAYDELESTVRKRAEKRRYPAMGYTSNLDLLCDFKTERLNELLEEHTPKARLDQMKAAEIIRTMQDLLETMVYYCSNGIGGEVDVENVELIKETFDFSYGMGGTAVQAALAREFGVERSAFDVSVSLCLDAETVDAQYAEWGIERLDNGFLRYQGEQVRIYRDEMLGSYQSRENGGVDIVVRRNRLGEITAVDAWHAGDDEYDRRTKELERHDSRY